MKKDESQLPIAVEVIEQSIYIIRGSKVMLDKDLAMLYGVETKKLIQAVKRNIERFPEDFMFQLTKEELENWKSQIVTSNPNCSRSQFVTLKRGQNIKYRPYSFTEQGVAMLSSVLHSHQAIKVNIEIMRAFIRLKQALTHSKELQEIKEFVLKKSNKTDREFRCVWRAIEKLTEKPKNQRKIGFNIN